MKSLFKTCRILGMAVSSFLFLLTVKPFAQTVSPEASSTAALDKTGLFDSDEILQITLTGDMRKLLRDKSDNPKDYPLTLSCTDAEGQEVVIPVEAKTRGNFRRRLGGCSHLPLMIKFSKEGDQSNTLFEEQRKLKLVMPCKGEQYVIREWLVYKIYNLVTPKSFRARLVKVKLNNTKKKNNGPSFYGFLLEEEKQMAKRNGLKSVERKLQPYEVERDAFLEMAVFEYLIGNTDWSIQYLQNIKLLAEDTLSTPTAVPYDFDQSGIVSAPYARPAVELKMKSVRERRYRGYCIRNPQVFEGVIARYNELKPDIYRIYTECELLDKKYIESTVRFLDEFYETINDPEKWQKEFAYPCDPKGTGNVVIKGLQEQWFVKNFEVKVH